MIDIRKKFNASTGDFNYRAGLRSRSQFGRAMWCIDEIDWPDGVQALELLDNRKSKQ